MGKNSFKGWHPIALSKKTKPNRIYSTKLLGEPIILYRNKDKEAVCLQDRCAHRSTPLSLGRLCNGTIECRYHGWQFNNQGQCIKIPALKKEGPFPPRACVPAKKVIEQHGIIWIHTKNNKCSESLPRHHSQLLDQHPGNDYRFEFSTDITIPHELMIENLLDPSHLPFAHHGTLSNREKAAPIDFSVEEVASGLHGTATIKNKSGDKNIIFQFIAPYTVCFDTTFNNTKGMRQIHYCIPLSKEKMRLISIFFYRNMPWLKYIPFMKKIQTIMSKKIVQQDIAMLSGQNKRINMGAKAWNSAINADKMATMYRQWLEQELAKGQPWFDSFNAQESVKSL